MARFPAPKRPRPPQTPSRAEMLAAVRAGAPVSMATPAGPRRPSVASGAWRPILPAGINKQEDGFLGPIGDIINFLDKPRAAVMSTAKMGVDLLQGEGDWKDALRLSFIPLTGGLSLATSKDWRNRVGDNYMFSEMLVEDFGMDPNSWATKGLGFIGDVAADPLMYIPGAGAAARTAQGGRWLKAAKAADDMAVGYAMAGDIAKANMMKAGAAKMARNRSIISGGKDVLDELGYKAGASLLVPGTGRLGRQIVEKPLNLLSGGKLTQALAKQRAKQVPSFMFDTPVWKVADNQAEVVEAMGLLRRGSNATKAQIAAIPKETRQAARFANSMQVEIPGSIKAFAGPLGFMAAGPGRLWGTTMRRTGLQNLNIGGQARPLRALSRSLNDDDVIIGLRALDARDVAKINKNNYMRNSARLSKIVRSTVTAVNEERVLKGLPEVGPEELLYLSDTPRTAVSSDLHELHDGLTEFWENKLSYYNESVGHRGAIPALKDELYAARFLDLSTEAGRKVKNIEIEDVEGAWAFRGMSGDDPTRKRKWVTGETYFGEELKAPSEVGKSIRQQMLDIGRKHLGEKYEDMFVKDFWEVVVRYDKATADRFFHQNWFNEMEKAGILQAGRSTRGGVDLTRDGVENLQKYLAQLAKDRKVKTAAFDKTEVAVARGVKAVREQDERITKAEIVIAKISDRLDVVNGELVRLDEIIEEVPEFATLTAAGRTRLKEFIKQFGEDFEKPKLKAVLNGDEMAVAIKAMEPLLEEINILREAQDQLQRVLSQPEEFQRAGGITPEGVNFAEFVETRLRSAESMVRGVAVGLIEAAGETVEVKALQQLAELSGDAFIQGMVTRSLPPGFVPPVDLLSNQPVKAYINDWAVDTQGFMQEADVIAYNEATGEALIRTPANAEIVGLKPNAPYLVSRQGDKFGHFEKPTSNAEFSGEWLPEGEMPYNFDFEEAKTSWRVLKAEVQVEAEALYQERWNYWEEMTGGELALPKPREWQYIPGKGKQLVNVDTADWDWWFEGVSNTPFGKAIARMWLDPKYKTHTGGRRVSGESVNEHIRNAVAGTDSVEGDAISFGANISPLQWMLETSTIELTGLRALAKGTGNRMSQQHSYVDEALGSAARTVAERLGYDADAIAVVSRGSIANAEPEEMITVDRAMRSTIQVDPQEEAELFAAQQRLESPSALGSFHFPERFENGDTRFPTNENAEFIAWRNRVLHEGDQTVEAPATPMSPGQLEGVAPAPSQPPRADQPEKLIDTLPQAADAAARQEIVDAGGIPSTVRIPKPSLLSSLETELTFLDDINQNENLRAAIHAVFRDGIDPDFIDTDPVTLDEVYGFITMLRTKERRLEGRLGLGPKEENVNFVAFLEPPDAVGWRTGGNQAQRESEAFTEWGTRSIEVGAWKREIGDPDKGPPPKSATDIPQNLTIDDLAFPNLSDAEAVVLKALWRAHDPDGSILTDEIFRLSGGHIEAFDESSTEATIRSIEQSKIGSTGESVWGKLEGAAQGYFDFDNYFKSVLFPQAIGSIEETERLLKPTFMQTQDLPISVPAGQRPYNVWNVVHHVNNLELVNDLDNQIWMGEDLLSLMYQLDGADPHVVQEYFAVINSAARDIRSLERRQAAIDASYEELISTGVKRLPSGRTIGQRSEYADDTFPIESYLETVEPVNVMTGKTIPPEDGWLEPYGYVNFFDISGAVPPKPLAEMTEVEWDAYVNEISDGIIKSLDQIISGGSRTQRRLDSRWGDPRQLRTGGKIEDLQLVFDDGWDNGKEIHAQLAAKFGNTEIADDIVAAIHGRPYEGWEGTLQRQRSNIDTHVSNLHVDGGPFHYTDSGKTVYTHPVLLRDMMIERGYVNPVDALEHEHPTEILEFLFGDIKVRERKYVTQLTDYNEVSLASLLDQAVEGGGLNVIPDQVQAYRDFPKLIKFHLDDLEAIVAERDGLRAARKHRLEQEHRIWTDHLEYNPQDPIALETLSRLDNEIANQSWMEFPPAEFDAAAVARITGATQSRQYWRDAGYEFVDEPRASGKGFPWGPPGPGSWRGPGKGPWPTPVQEPVMAKLGKDVDTAAVRRQVVKEVAESGNDELFAHPQARSFAENMAMVEALDEVINAKIILREGDYEAGIQARIERVQRFRAQMQPVIAALGRQIRQGELSDELLPKGKVQKGAARQLSTVEPTEQGILPIGFTDRPLVDIKQEALLNVQANILEQFDKKVDHLERLLVARNEKAAVLQVARDNEWEAAAELMQFDNAAALIELDLLEELELLAQSPNVLDQVSAAASQEDAIRAVMNNRVMMSSFGDAYGSALTNFAQSYRQISQGLVPGGRGGGGGGAPSYFMGGMSDDGWKLFEEAVVASAGLSDPRKMSKALDAYLKVANWWKAQAVASPGFIMRNLMGGAMINSMVAGVEMGTHSRIGAMAQAAANAGENDLILGARTLALQGKDTRLPFLGMGVARKATVEDWEVFAQLLESGVVGQGQAWSEITSTVLQNRMPLERTRKLGFMEGLLQDGWKGGWNPFSADFRPFTAVRTQNERAEFVLRGALGFDIMKKGGSPQDAMNAINKFHFDYQDLTNLERTIKAVVPFYTWQKNIIPVLIESLGKKPQAWTGFLRAKVALELGQDDEGVVPDYYAEMMGIALPFKWGGRFGGRIHAVPDTPFRQLFQLTKEPTSAARTVVGSTFPWIKTPVEIWAGKQMFADIPFSGRYQQVPAAYKAVPGLMSALKMFGKAEKNNQGEWKMRDHDIYLIEQLSPIFGRHRRLFGNETAKRRRAATTWVSFLFGGGFRVNDFSERRNQLIKDQVGHSNDMRDILDIENRKI